MSQTLCWTMFEAREPASTIKFVDDYCQWYRKLFPEVRSFEAFKYLHVGMISDIKRKTLPAISRIVGLSNEQGLLHFLSESPWQLEQLRQARLRLIVQVLAGREITLIIDETGDIIDETGDKKRLDNKLCKTAVHWKFRKNREWNSCRAIMECGCLKTRE